jgi:4-hydroxy-3-methylbut-2-en-1-yl diphosphate synthase IspG/GcpE
MKRSIVHYCFIPVFFALDPDVASFLQNVSRLFSTNRQIVRCTMRKDDASALKTVVDDLLLLETVGKK